VKARAAKDPPAAARGAASSHYETLGVDPDSDERAIRAAYVRRMKAVHPDLALPAYEAGAEQARALNQAYQVLRDPRRRRAYDRALREAGGAAPPPDAGDIHLPVVVPPEQWLRRTRAERRPPTAWRSWLGGAAIGVSLSVCAWLVWTHPGLPSSGRQGMIAESLVSDSYYSAGPPEQVDPVVVDRAVRNFVMLWSSGGPRQVERYSQACTAEFQSTPTPLLLDHCVAFDVAASSLQAADARAAEQAVMTTHLKWRSLGAFTRLVEENRIADGRVRDITQAALSHMVTGLAPRIEPPRRDPPPPPLPLPEVPAGELPLPVQPLRN
jgi:hypothetical protein